MPALPCARVRAWVRECAYGRGGVCCVLSFSIREYAWGFPSAASMSGSLLLVDVRACPDRVRRVYRTLDWGCAQ
jgi:hypothetical protein